MLGENIRKLRKQKGLTQEELAIRLNVVRQTVFKREKIFLFLMQRCWEGLQRN